MIKIRFLTIKMAIDHAQWHGGWIFASVGNETILWFNQYNYTEDEIIASIDMNGFLGDWKQHQRRMARIEDDDSWIR